MIFLYKVISVFIIHQDLSFGGIALKIESEFFVDELINYLFMKLFFLLLGYVIIIALQCTHWLHIHNKWIMYKMILKIISGTEGYRW